MRQNERERHRESDREKEGADGAILKNYQGLKHQVNFFEKIFFP